MPKSFKHQIESYFNFNLSLNFSHRGMVDESGDQFVAYFLPTEETLGKRKRDAEDGIPYAPDDEYAGC